MVILEQKVENRSGPLVVTVPQFQLGSWRTAAELQAERRTRRGLRGEIFYPANLSLYRVDSEGKVCIGIGGKQIFGAIAASNIEAFCQELVNTGNYLLKPAQVEELSRLELDITWVDAYGLRLSSQLGLYKHDDEIASLEIDTLGYEDSLYDDERTIAEAVHGSGDDFIKTMKVLAHARIGVTHVYVLDPEYVREHVTQNGVIARPHLLHTFTGRSDLEVIGSLVCAEVDVRGIPKPTDKN